MLEHAEGTAQVVVGIETDSGLLADALTAAGCRAVAVNPSAAARYRDRHHISGATSDVCDAKLLADLVCTDRHTDSSVTCAAAYATAPNTTNTKPANRARLQRRLT